jgi:hypothetical protein
MKADKDGEQEIWITAYALEGPVYSVMATRAKVGRMWSQNEAFDDSEWKPTKQGAITEARRLRRKRIQELKREIKRLEDWNK